MTMYYWGKNFGATIVFFAMANLQTIDKNPTAFVGFLLGSLVLSFAFFIAGKLVLTLSITQIS